MSALRPHIRATLSLALPLIGSQVAQIAVGITDTIMLGWYSVEALAAGTLGTTFYFVVFFFGSGFGIAVMPMVAAAASAEDPVQVRRVTRMGLWIAAIVGALALVPFVFSAPILTLLGQEPALAEGAQTYLRIAGFGMVFSLIIMVLRSHLSALERTRIVFLSTLAGAGLNVVLNWVFIFGNFGAPELGLRGAAVASLGTYALMAAILALYAARARGLRDYALFHRLWRRDPQAFGQVFRLGWPIGLTQLSEGGLFSASAVMIGWLGAVPLAAHGIALQIAALTFMMHVGLSSAATVRGGRAWGRGDAEGLRLSAIAAIMLSGVVVVCTIALFLGVPELLIGLFLDPGEPERAAIVSLGAVLLAMAALFQFADAGQIMALGLLRAVQDTRTPMVYAVICYWGIGLPASYVFGFPLGYGPAGVWFGLALGLACAATLMMARFWRGAGRRVAAPAV